MIGPRFAIALCAGLALGGCAAPGLAPVDTRPAPGESPAPAPEPSRRGIEAVEPGARTAPLPEGGAATPRALPPPGPQPAPAARPANPAVVALLGRANADAQAGRHASAAASLERALKIEPDNAWLWHRLAAARFDEGRHGEAAALAAKSNALAAADRSLMARNWRLIARVHRQRGEDVAAREAEAQARRLDTSAGG